MIIVIGQQVSTSLLIDFEKWLLALGSNWIHAVYNHLPAILDRIFLFDITSSSKYLAVTPGPCLLPMSVDREKRRHGGAVLQ